MFGYGPRYLHSTGQLHKGGPDTGLFVQVVDETGEELPIPDPLVWLSWVAAHTSTIKLGVGVCMINERDPILLA